MKKLIFIIPLLLLFSCKNNNNNIIIKGEIQEAENASIYLERINTSNKEIIDSIKLDKEGKFKFNFNSDKNEFYSLRLTNGKIINLIAKPNDEIKILSKASLMNTVYTVEGSIDSELIRTLNRKLNKTRNEIASLKAEIEINGETSSLKKKYLNIINSQREFTANFIMKNAISLSSYMAIYQKIDKNTYTLNENRDIEYMKIVASSMKALHPDNQYTKAILANIEKLNKEISNINIKKLIKEKGDQLPNIVLKNTKGKDVDLKSLKGKFIILNFWASQDKNSRKLNKTLKKIYKRNKSKGLEIYQVSVDNNKAAWMQAIKQDDLNWINVCEPKTGSALAVQTFNIQSIPANYLINKKGEIVGKNLYGIALQEKISDLLK